MGFDHHFPGGGKNRIGSLTLPELHVKRPAALADSSNALHYQRRGRIAALAHHPLSSPTYLTLQSPCVNRSDLVWRTSLNPKALNRPRRSLPRLQNLPPPLPATLRRNRR